MFFLSDQTFSDSIGQENVSDQFPPPLIGHHWTHFLVRLNLKTFDRTRKTLIGREKSLIGQEKSWSDDEIWSEQRWKDVQSEGGKHD